VATDYELWATQHGLEYAQPVEVLEFSHPDFDSEWLVRYGEDFDGTTETGEDFHATAVAFSVELPKTNNSTQSEMSIRMDALGGYVISRIRAMTDLQRQEPMRIVWRVYLDTDPSAPVLDPLEFYLVDVSATRLALELRCAADILPNIAAGIRYTIDTFPTLAYL
jgi:hypothetical protein